MNARYLGLLAVPIFVALLLSFIVIFYPERGIPQTPVYEIPSPFSSAHSLFLSISALIVSYFFARAFLAGGSLNLVGLGSGSLILGLGFLLSQILGSWPFGGPNQLTGISSLVFLFTGIFFGVSVTLGRFDKTPRHGRPMVTLLAGYLGGIVLIAVLIIAVEVRLVPDFFLAGVGPTALRQQVLAAAIVLFAYSSIVLMSNYSRSHSPILFWFSLGLALVAFGFVSALIGKFPGGPFSWLGRITVAVGGIYFILAVLQAYKGIGAGANKPSNLGQT